MLYSYVDAVNMALFIKAHDEPEADIEALTNEIWAEMQAENNA